MQARRNHFAPELMRKLSTCSIRATLLI